jgi:hypothetical protein
VTFERWVLPWDAAEELLTEAIKAARSLPETYPPRRIALKAGRVAE